MSLINKHKNPCSKGQCSPLTTALSPLSSIATGHYSLVCYTINDIINLFSSRTAETKCNRTEFMYSKKQEARFD